MMDDKVERMLNPERPTETLEAKAAAVEKMFPDGPEVMNSAWGSVWLHGNWRYLTKNMTTPQREYAADCVARWSARLAEDDGDEERGEPEGLRWWREAS